MEKNIFDEIYVEKIIERIHNLTPESQPLWGKMSVGQMLAHCNVAYEYVYTDKHPKPNFLMGLMLKLFVKKIVTGTKEYKKNGPTAPAFIITDLKDFEFEKGQLINYINRTLEHGKDYFDGKVSLSFGKMNGQEWNNMFSNHLNHHLTQFGV
ncbi:MAG: DUF1569 domain-containing protein [Flavobacteriia bacterium]|nr:DUF1569 domain-containing protein [Flavobacteriia bacterium]